jgi:hypothetical protein
MLVTSFAQTKKHTLHFLQLQNKPLSHYHERERSYSSSCGRHRHKCQLFKKPQDLCHLRIPIFFLFTLLKAASMYKTPQSSGNQEICTVFVYYFYVSFSYQNIIRFFYFLFKTVSTLYKNGTPEI